MNQLPVNVMCPECKQPAIPDWSIIMGDAGSGAVIEIEPDPGVKLIKNVWFNCPVCEFRSTIDRHTDG